MNIKPSRIWQIDAVRGIAVLGMIIYHLLFDIEYIFQIPVGSQQLPLIIFARTVATTFILLVGFSASLKFQKIKSYGPKKVIMSFGKNAIKISLYALLITLVTFLVFPQDIIFFGILHFISLSLLLLLPFLYLRSNKLVSLVALIIIVLGTIVPTINTLHNWLLIIGIKSPNFSGFDYFPLLPWFGVVLIGLVLGRKHSPSLQKLNPSKTPPLFLYRIFSGLGQHSLSIYLWHQPVLWTILMAIKKLS